MCGIAGFSGIPHKRRLALAFMLGMGVDTRGGHAAGFARIAPDGRITSKRRVGYWASAPDRFVRHAADSEAVIIHGRYATCGKRTADEAHPFVVHSESGDRTIWGIHNGVIYNADESAAMHNRKPHPVDSYEIFRLLVDDRPIDHLCGYGVISWIDTRHPGKVFLARISPHSDLYVAGVKGGGAVWGSTYDIVKAAAKTAGITLQCSYTLDEIGRVYYVEGGRVFTSTVSGVKLGDRYPESRWTFTSQGYDWEAWDEEYDLAFKDM